MGHKKFLFKPKVMLVVIILYDDINKIMSLKHKTSTVTIGT